MMSLLAHEGGESSLWKKSRPKPPKKAGHRVARSLQPGRLRSEGAAARLSVSIHEILLCHVQRNVAPSSFAPERDTGKNTRRESAPHAQMRLAQAPCPLALTGCFASAQTNPAPAAMLARFLLLARHCGGWGSAVANQNKVNRGLIRASDLVAVLHGAAVRRAFSAVTFRVPAPTDSRLFLQRPSLSRLAPFWSVLKGEMTLLGRRARVVGRETDERTGLIRPPRRKQTLDLSFGTLLTSVVGPDAGHHRIAPPRARREGKT